MGRIFEFIANSSDGVFAVDRRQSIVLWNEPASRILGYTAEEALGRKCYGIVGGRDAVGCTVCRRGCDAIMAGQRLTPAPSTDMAVRAKTGTDVWLNVSTVLVPSRRGELSALVHLFREVTRDHEVLGAAQQLAETVSLQRTRLPRPRSRDASSGPAKIGLTRREREILSLVASGTSTDVIAQGLCISPRTVRNHINNLLGKLDVHSRLEAVVYATKNGLT